MSNDTDRARDEHEIDLDLFAHEHGLTRDQVDALVKAHGKDRLKLKMAADGLSLGGDAEAHPAPGQEWNAGAPRLMS